MTDLPVHITPERWVVRMFSARCAAKSGIVRRKVSDVERLPVRDRFLHEARRRSFRALENAGQFTVCCNRDPVRVQD